MCKCQRYGKHSAIKPVIAFQHSWQEELSRSSVSSFTIWLWSHFHAGHSCTKSVCVLYYKDICFSMRKNVNYVVSSPPTASFQEKAARKMQGKCTKTNKNCVCPVVSQRQNINPQSYRCSTPSGGYLGDMVSNPLLLGDIPSVYVKLDDTTGNCTLFIQHHWPLLVKLTIGAGKECKEFSPNPRRRGNLWWHVRSKTVFELVFTDFNLPLEKLILANESI